MVVRILLQLAVVIAALGIQPDRVAAQAPPPLSAYGELPAFEDATISPSGNLIAVIATVSGTRALIVVDRDNVLVKSVPVEKLKIFGIDWAGESHILLRVSQTQDLPPFWNTDQVELQQALIVPLHSDKRAERVFENNRDILDNVFGYYGMRNIGGRWKAYFRGTELVQVGRTDYRLGSGQQSLFEVDIETNKATRVAAAPDRSRSATWLVDAQGRDAATLERTNDGRDWRILNARGKELASGSASIVRARLFSLGADGQSVIYMVENPATRKEEWFEVPLNGTAPPKQVFDGIDVAKFFVDRTTGALMGYLEAGPKKPATFDDPVQGETVDEILKASPEANVRFVEWTPDFANIIIRTNGPADSGSWYIVNLSRNEAKMFGNERPDIPSSFVGPVREFEYRARDGMELDGVLTLPPGREAKNLPVVILPHGGPHAHDEVQFDWWAQAYASRGYAVLQPNFRGSTNRDEAFRLAGYGEWGRKMQTDLTDGLNALADAGIIDKARACIVGASYGGYAALAGVTIEQGIYRCAVAVAPVTDIGLTIRTDYSKSGQHSAMMKILKEEFGAGIDYDAISPRRLAGQADAPIMLIHGREDTVVDYRQSKVMADALERAGKEFELVDLKAEDHWLTRSATRLEMLESAVKFVLKHNPPD